MLYTAVGLLIFFWERWFLFLDVLCVLPVIRMLKNKTHWKFKKIGVQWPSWLLWPKPEKTDIAKSEELTPYISNVRCLRDGTITDLKVTASMHLIKHTLMAAPPHGMVAKTTPIHPHKNRPSKVTGNNLNKPATTEILQVFLAMSQLYESQCHLNEADIAPQCIALANEKYEKTQTYINLHTPVQSHSLTALGPTLTPPPPQVVTSTHDVRSIPMALRRFGTCVGFAGTLKLYHGNECHFICACIWIYFIVSPSLLACNMLAVNAFEFTLCDLTWAGLQGKCADIFFGFLM